MSSSSPLEGTVTSTDNLSEFQSKIATLRVPIVLRKCDIGPCVDKWSVDYLISVVNPLKKVKVHKSLVPQLNFVNKNFTYETISFHDLVKNCSNRNGESYWYLRSLGEDPRGKDVSDISVHFPEISSDIQLPEVFHKEAFFSSVFRISSPDLQLWTHYDTCDNILVQIRGRKRVLFYPPNEALNLYLSGDKSLVLDVDDPDLSRFPKFVDVCRLEVFLEEGDIVFIPALWFHNITALDFSISVNVFWKNLSLDLYDKKDTYGNRDPVPAQLAFKTFDKGLSQLKSLPTEYEDFYLRRMIIALHQRLENLQLQPSETN